MFETNFNRGWEIQSSCAIQQEKEVDFGEQSWVYCLIVGTKVNINAIHVDLSLIPTNMP